MTGKILLFSLFIIGVVALGGCSGASSEEVDASSGLTTGGVHEEFVQKGQRADKIEVVHFHGVNQCWACITVGKYALKTIEDRFSQEHKEGTIVFRDINGELEENRDMVMKYQARGSSLFVNAIAQGEDHIEEEVTVWRLIVSEDKFIDYLEGKLRALMEG